MLGERLTDTDSGDVFEVVGQDGQEYVVQCLTDFRPPFAATPAELSLRFKVEAAEPERGSDQQGWKQLAAASRAAAVADRVPSATVVPETIFRAQEGDRSAAQAWATAIAANPAQVDLWRQGVLNVHKAVDRELRQLVSDDD